MTRPSVLLLACGVIAGWAKNSGTSMFPPSPDNTRVEDYLWTESQQRAQVETSDGMVFFRRFIPAEVFASKLAEKLGLCLSKAHYIPWGTDESHGWQDSLSDVSRVVPSSHTGKIEYLFEDQVGVQEVEFINGAVLQGYQAIDGYEDLIQEIGRLFAFDIFINDPHNCRFTDGWTCRDGDNFNFIVSPDRGVCGHTRAYNRLEITSPQGLKFRQFFQLAVSKDTSTELSRQLAHVAFDLFGDNLSLDRRLVAEKLLDGAREVMDALADLTGQDLHEIVAASGLHASFEFGMGERIRMLRIIMGQNQVKHASNTVYGGEFDTNQAGVDGIQQDDGEDMGLGGEGGILPADSVQNSDLPDTVVESLPSSSLSDSTSDPIAAKAADGMLSPLLDDEAELAAEAEMNTGEMPITDDMVVTEVLVSGASEDHDAQAEAQMEMVVARQELEEEEAAAEEEEERIEEESQASVQQAKEEAGVQEGMEGLADEDAFEESFIEVEYK